MRKRNVENKTEPKTQEKEKSAKEIAKKEEKSSVCSSLTLLFSASFFLLFVLLFLTVFDLEIELIDDIKSAISSQVQKLGIFEVKSEARLRHYESMSKDFKLQTERNEKHFEEIQKEKTGNKTAVSEKKKRKTKAENDFLVHTRHLEKVACFTLENYSDTFIDATPALLKTKRKEKHFFRCGVRVSDLRYLALEGLETREQREEILELCQVSNSDEMNTAYPHLRILLTKSELKMHEAQKTNIALQTFPLSYFNDDYCDCFDGTDELSTNACSAVINGGILLAGARLKQYRETMAKVSLYEGGAITTDKHKIMFPNSISKQYTVSGPVLPFQCGSTGKNVSKLFKYDVETNATQQLQSFIAPSMVGDGIVDCPDGSDEAMPQIEQQYIQKNNDSDERRQLLRRFHDNALKVWQDRKASLKVYLLKKYEKTNLKDIITMQPAARSPYYSPLYPHYNSPIALLVEKGYTSLFDASDVAAQRKNSLEILLKRYSAGHEKWKERMDKGWLDYGIELTKNHTLLKNKYLEQMSRAEAAKGVIMQKMELTGSRSLRGAGVTQEEYENFVRQQQMGEAMMEHLHYLTILLNRHGLGDKFEYYPLFVSPVTIKEEQVTGWKPNYKPSRVINVSEMVVKQMARAQQQEIEFHIDNMTFSEYMFTPVQSITAAQAYKEKESELVYKILGLDPATEAQRNDGNMMRKSPIIILGKWQPLLIQKHNKGMTFVDSAGDVAIARRAMVLPTSWLYRGGGVLQWPARVWEEVYQREGKKGANNTTGQQQSQDDPSSNDGQAVRKPLYYNTPHALATHVFSLGPPCTMDPPTDPYYRQKAKEEEKSMTEDEMRRRDVVGKMVSHANFVCDEKDSILVMARNGKCTWEIIIGTPSACTPWSLEQLEGQLSPYKNLQE